MQIQRVNRTDPEKVFLNLKNGGAAILYKGMGARLLGPGVWANEAASSDGTQVIPLESEAVGAYAFMGIADQDIASLGYGRVQAWGYVDSIMLSSEGTSITVGLVSFIETVLQVGGISGTWTSGGQANLQSMSTKFYRYVHVLSSTTVSTTAWAKGFVRSL